MSRGKGFDPDDAERLLVECHRRCCVCHKFCGSSIELDHITPVADGGSDEIDNAIPLCFDCHAEAHHYNPAHPRGRRFRPSELRHHRDQWLGICREHPEIFVNAQPKPEAGSLQRLHSELLFDQALTHTGRGAGAPLEIAQFRRAIGDGVLGWVPEELRKAIEDAYISILEVNSAIAALAYQPHNDNKAAQLLVNARQPIAKALARLDAAL